MAFISVTEYPTCVTSARRLEVAHGITHGRKLLTEGVNLEFIVNHDVETLQEVLVRLGVVKAADDKSHHWDKRGCVLRHGRVALVEKMGIPANTNGRRVNAIFGI